MDFSTKDFANFTKHFSKDFNKDLSARPAGAQAPDARPILKIYGENRKTEGI